MRYPIILKMSTVALRELAESEEGSFSDSLTDSENGLTPDREPRAHAYMIASRLKTRLAIFNDAEAIDVYYAVCSGTFQLTHYRAAVRIADWLRPVVARVSPKTVIRWPAPSGR